MGLSSSFCVKNTEGYVWSIGAEILEKECYAAKQFTKTKKVGRTELSCKLKDAGHAVVHAKFRKQITAKQAAESIKNADADSLTNSKKIKALAEQVTSGPERLMVCHLQRDIHDKTTEELGRSTVTDLELDGNGYSRRLIDHRTLEWVVVEGVKYTLS